MENRVACRPLYYAGAVLLVFVVLAHLTVSNPEGGILSAVGTLIVSLFQIALLIIGLTIGIAVCIAVMLGLYVASAYLISSELGEAAAEKVKRAVSTQWRLALTALHVREGQVESDAEQQGNASAPSTRNVDATTEKGKTLDELSARIDALERQCASLAGLPQQVDALREELRQYQKEALKAH